MKTFIIILIGFCVGSVFAQGSIVPQDKGRFINGHELNQSSGLFYEGYDQFITHNDQGNPTMRLYRFQPSSGTSNVFILDTIDVNYANRDWEDLTTDRESKLYICETGKNCNANSPPDCPSRFIFQFLEIPVSSLHTPGAEPIVPLSYYFVYPKVGSCGLEDTVFANVEACVYDDDYIYLFTKDIWSKNTNNCGSWMAGYTYRFRVPLQPGSSIENPIVAEYLDNFQLEVIPGEPYADQKALSASLSPSGGLLALTSATRLWLFYNFSGNDWFNGSHMYLDYKDINGNKISRGYEGLEFINDTQILLSVDGNNGRVQQLDLAGLIDYGQVGIGTSQPKKPLHVKNGDVFIDQNGGGLIMKSPNGSCFRIVVSDNGTLQTEAISCP